MRYLLVFAGALVLCGCVPNVDDYYYISLAHHTEVRVIQEGKPQNSNLYFANEAPLGYSYERESYELRLKLAMDDYWAAVLISATTLEGEPLAITPLPFGACGSFEHLGKAYSLEGAPAQKYVWSPAFHRDCSVDGNDGFQPDQIIAFEVTSEGGVRLGSESLAFELVQNGSYLSVDSI